MTRWQSNTLIAYALIGIPLAFVLAVWGLSGLTAHYILAADSIAQTGKEAQGTLAYLNDPNKGMLMMLDQDIGELHSAIVHADLVARHEQQQLGKYDQYAANFAAQSSDLLVSLKGTANAATGTAQETTAVLSSVRDDIGPIKPLLVSITASSDDLDALLKDAAIKQTLANLDTTSGNLATVSGNFARVTTFYADDVTKPKTLKQKIESRVGLGLDAAGFALRHF